jgi:hypothetical protein
LLHSHHYRKSPHDCLIFLSSSIISHTEKTEGQQAERFQKENENDAKLHMKKEKSEEDVSEGRVAKMNLADGRVEELSDCSTQFRF